MAAATISCRFWPATRMKTEDLGITSSATTGIPARPPIRSVLPWIIWIRRVIMKVKSKADSLGGLSNTWIPERICWTKAGWGCRGFPATYPSWLPLPIYFVGFPESSFYPRCQHTVERNLDEIIDSLSGTQEFRFPSAEELDAYEQSNPHPEGKHWCVAEQTIGNYYWGSSFIVRDLEILRKFGRLDFELPVVSCL